MIPSMQEFMLAAEQGRLLRHDYFNLVGFKYTTNTVYSEDWDSVSLHARGIVFDKNTGDVVARPFDKFFNYGELVNGDGNLSSIAEAVMQHQGYFNLKFSLEKQTFRVMDKLDGSLGIMFWTGNEWLVKTAGSFESDQAVWANKWASINLNFNLFDKSKTYLFEIICDEDVHPIKYDYEGLVLLGITDTASGKEVSTEELVSFAHTANLKHADIIEFSNFNDVLNYAKHLPNTKEGVVVTFENGFKLKIKGDEFLKLQKIFHALTPDTIWEHFDWENAVKTDEFDASVFKDNFIQSIPEEMPEYKTQAVTFANKFFNLLTVVEKYGKEIAAIADRKDAYQKVISNEATKPFAAPIMMYYTSHEINTKIRYSIYKMMRP